MVIATPNP